MSKLREAIEAEIIQLEHIKGELAGSITRRPKSTPIGITKELVEYRTRLDDLIRRMKMHCHDDKLMTDANKATVIPPISHCPECGAKAPSHRLNCSRWERYKTNPPRGSIEGPEEFPGEDFPNP